MERGRFITLEGGEGAGKTTQLKHLAQALRACGRRVVVTREPGGSVGAEEIRGLLVTGAVGRWGALTEALLHFAARRDHVERTIWPALEQGTWVLCDRFVDSTRAYQGAGLGVAPEVIEQLARITLGEFVPDITLLLDVAPEVGLRRASQRNAGHERYEQMSLEFHHRLRGGFLEIAKREPARCVVIDAAGSEPDVGRAVVAAVEQRFGRGDCVLGAPMA